MMANGGASMAATAKVKTVNYPSSDGKPMAETDWHAHLIMYTVMLFRGHFAARDDVYVSGNSFVYYEQGSPKKRLAPDTHVVFGRPNHFRNSYKVWEEDFKFPAVVLEYTSRKTRLEDLNKKLEIYRDVWKVKEYILFDPTSDYLRPNTLRGYRLVDDEYLNIELDGHQLTSRVLNMTLERYERGLIYRDATTGERILLPSELRAKQAEDLIREESEKRHRVENELEELKARLLRMQQPASNGHG